LIVHLVYKETNFDSCFSLEINSLKSFFDITGSLGSMSSRGSLYNKVASAPPDVITWSDFLCICFSSSNILFLISDFGFIKV
jgi:hypothetical protein